jgi:hypothetical protein
MQEEFEENKGVIKICRPKKDRQHNDQKTEGQTTQWSKDRRTDNTMIKKGEIRTNNDLQNTTQKTKDRATRTPLKLGVNSGALS